MRHTPHAELQAAQHDLRALRPRGFQDLFVDRLLNERTRYSLEEGFSDLSELVRHYRDKYIEPRRIQPVSRYGKAALQLLQRNRDQEVAPRKALKMRFCFEAELTLHESLIQATEGRLTKPRYQPAVLLTDPAGDLLGIIKQRGLPTFYTWKPVDVATSGGTVHLPAASFSELKLSDTVQLAKDKPVQRIVASEQTIEHAQFGRFDMTHFSAASRIAVAEHAIHQIGGLPRLEAYLDETVEYRPSDIAHAVGALLLHERD